MLNEIAEQSKQIVLVFGRLCSGKGTFCEPYIKQGYTHITTSDIVRKVSGAKSRSDLQNTQDMDQLIADEMINTISQSQPIVVDGIRQNSIIDRVLSEFGDDNVELIWLDAPADVRRERFANRGASKDDRSFDDAEAGDSKLGLDDVESKFKPRSRLVKHY